MEETERSRVIAVCVPSRGLVFSKTMQSVVRGMQELGKLGVASDLFMTHDLTIPDSHAVCVEQALQNPAVTKLFFIEEDNYLFPDAFVAVATSDYPIVTLQYNDKNGSPHGIIHYNEAGDILWAGLGATCINRTVFEAINRPYFRTDHRYKVIKKRTGEDGRLIVDYEEIEPRQTWNDKENKFEEIRDEYKYGGLDIDFYTRARKAGYKAVALPSYKAHHFQLVKLGEPHTNQGVHEIRQV